MGRKVKCQYCEITDTPKEDMECIEITSGKTTTRKYYHKDECYDNHIKKQNFLDEENEKKDRLNEVIKAVHKIEFVPDGFWYLLADVRNGNYTHNRKVKKYKEGFSYDVIAETYIYARHEIRKYKKIKKFDGVTNELRYGLVIVKDKIMYVKEQINKHEEKKKNEQFIKENSRPDVDIGVQVEFKKKKVENDISKYLDDND